MSSPRIVEISVLRGIFCILVTWVHVTFFIGARSLGEIFFDTTRVPAMSDSFYLMWVFSEQLAPIGFFLLLGVSLALSHAYHADRPDHSSHHFKRGLFVMLMDIIIRPLWLLTPLEVLHMGHNQGATIFFVFGIYLNLGISIIICNLLSKIPTFYLTVIAVTGLVWSGLVDVFDDFFDDYHSVIASIFLLPGINSGVKTTFNVIPWVSYSMLGMVYGRALIQRPLGYIRKELFLAAVLIGTVFLARQLQMVPADRFWFVSKYPPNLFLTGGAIAFVIVFLNLVRFIKKENGLLHPLAHIGENSLLFYSLHFPLFILLGFGIKRFTGDYIMDNLILHCVWIVGLWVIYKLTFIRKLSSLFKEGFEWNWHRQN